VRRYVPGNGEFAVGSLLRRWALKKTRPMRGGGLDCKCTRAMPAAPWASRHPIHGGMVLLGDDFASVLRRAKAVGTALGDATFHRERIARLVIDPGSGGQGA